MVVYGDVFLRRSVACGQRVVNRKGAVVADFVGAAFRYYIYPVGRNEGNVFYAGCFVYRYVKLLDGGGEGNGRIGGYLQAYLLFRVAVWSAAAQLHRRADIALLQGVGKGKGAVVAYGVGACRTAYPTC